MFYKTKQKRDYISEKNSLKKKNNNNNNNILNVILNKKEIIH